MFGKIGKEYAESIAEKVEALTLNKLDEYRPPDEDGSNKSRGKITNEKMAKVNGRRRALFIGINYKGQKNELAYVVGLSCVVLFCGYVFVLRCVALLLYLYTARNCLRSNFLHRCYSVSVILYLIHSIPSLHPSFLFRFSDLSVPILFLPHKPIHTYTID